MSLVVSLLFIGSMQPVSVPSAAPSAKDTTQAMKGSDRPAAIRGNSRPIATAVASARILRPARISLQSASSTDEVGQHVKPQQRIDQNGTNWFEFS
jgi:hypothetical protein